MWLGVGVCNLIAYACVEEGGEGRLRSGVCGGRKGSNVVKGIPEKMSIFNFF